LRAPSKFSLSDCCADDPSCDPYPQRTPLTLIAGPVKDLLQLQQEGSVEKELLTVTHRNVQRLGRLVDMRPSSHYLTSSSRALPTDTSCVACAVMDVSRVEAGRMQGLFSPRRLGRLVADLASLFRSAIEKAGLEFIVEWDPEETRLVYVDSDMFEKIVFNVRSPPS
jgi:signal transduction histidine kinase